MHEGRIRKCLEPVKGRYGQPVAKAVLYLGIAEKNASDQMLQFSGMAEKVGDAIFSGRLIVQIREPNVHRQDWSKGLELFGVRRLAVYMAVPAMRGREHYRLLTRSAAGHSSCEPNSCLPCKQKKNPESEMI